MIIIHIIDKIHTKYVLTLYIFQSGTLIMRTYGPCVWAVWGTRVPSCTEALRDSFFTIYVFYDFSYYFHTPAVSGLYIAIGIRIA